MSKLGKILIGAALGAGALALSGMSASAEVVCNGDVCWHVQSTYEYPSDARVVVHPDTWRWGPSEHYTWREHEGRGYWRADKWIAW